MSRAPAFLVASFLFCGILFSHLPVFAADAKGTTVGTVTTDGAMVYAQPDFDASVIGQLKRGNRVRMSKGTAGGAMGKFHKVRIGNKTGYVADIDIRAEGAPDPVRAAEAAAKAREQKEAIDQARGKKAKNRDKDKAKDKDKPRPHMPMFFSRFVGLLYGVTEFKEDIANVDASTSLPMYGLKVTGPDVLIEGPIIDFNLALHYGAPSYYDALSLGKPSGFVLLTDALMLLPFMERENLMIFAGLGPMVFASRFNVINNNRAQTLTTVNLGLSSALGVGFRFGKVAIRLEGKYFIEKKSYKAAQLGLQTEF